VFFSIILSLVFAYTNVISNHNCCDYNIIVQHVNTLGTTRPDGGHNIEYLPEFLASNNSYP
jgi:hypothetical protein